MSNPTTYILLIRHGENDWVGQNRLAGRTAGVHLNETGHKQARRIAASLADKPVSAIYSSPMVRCMETAQPLADKLGLTVTEESGILEVDYGEWQGGKLKELSERPEWKLVQHAPSSFRFPEGETLLEVQMRAITAIDEIRQRHPDQLVALFSHGDVIRTSLAHYLGIPFDLFQRVVVGTGSTSGIMFHGPIPRVLFSNFSFDLPEFTFDKRSDTKDKDAEADADETKQTGQDGLPS